MTVTVTITPAKTLTRGWSGAITLTLTNTGDETIKSVYIKINSAAGAIFSSFSAKTVAGYQNCLNTYTTSTLPWASLAPSASVDLDISVAVKSDATLGAATLTWYLQYEV